MFFNTLSRLNSHTSTHTQWRQKMLKHHFSTNTADIGHDGRSPIISFDLISEYVCVSLTVWFLTNSLNGPI